MLVDQDLLGARHLAEARDGEEERRGPLASGVMGSAGRESAGGRGVGLQGAGGGIGLEGDLLEQLGDHVVGGEPLDAGVVVEDDAVAQHGGRDELDVLEAGVGALGHQGAGLGGGGQGERGPRAGAVLDALGGARLAGVGGIDEAGDVVADHLGQVDAADQRAGPRRGWRRP